MLALVLRVLANGAPCPRWPVKTSECTVESQGSWPMCAIRQRLSGWERYRLPQLTEHTIMSHSGEMNPWKRHIILITKGFGVSFYDTCDWRTIMYSLIPSTSQQPAFWRLNLCNNDGISRSKQEHVRFLSLSLCLSPPRSHSLALLHYIKHQSDKLAHA